MRDMLDKYIDTVFADAPTNDTALKLRDEMKLEIYADYDRSLSRGLSKSAAYDAAIKSVSDLRELAEAMKRSDNMSMDKGLFGDESYSQIQDAAGAFESMPEDDKKTVMGALSSVMWLLVTAGYFGVSFLTGWWHLTWVIFLMAAAVSTGISTSFDIRKIKHAQLDYKQYKKLHKRIEGGFSSIMWLSIVTLYILASFLTGWWHVTWIIFLLGSAAQVILSTAFKLNRRKY